MVLEHSAVLLSEREEYHNNSSKHLNLVTRKTLLVLDSSGCKTSTLK